MSTGQARSLRERALRAAIFALFPYPRRLRALRAPLRLRQRAGLDRLAGRGRTARRLAPELSSAPALRAWRPPPARPAAAPAARHACPGGSGPRQRRAVVGMLTGCVQGVFFPQVNAATARVLALEGCDVVIPRGQGCCGALSLHSGRAAEAPRFARRTIATFEQAGVDAIVVNAAGCGSAMKEYARLLRRDDAGWADARRDERQGPRPRRVPRRARAGGAAPPLPVTRRLPRRLPPGPRAGDPPAATRPARRRSPAWSWSRCRTRRICCGSAGTYNLFQPEAARELGDRKAERCWPTGADLLVSANPGCTMQIASALAERGEDIAVAHTAEVLDASLRGRPAARLADRPAPRLAEPPAPRLADSDAPRLATGLLPDALEPGFQGVRTPWIRGFMAFQRVRHQRRARPRGTIVRSGWNCPGEPTPSAPLLISARTRSCAADRGRPPPAAR